MVDRMNDRVRISYSRGEVKIPWASRAALLEEIRHGEAAVTIVAAFEGVGTSRPVVLAADEGWVLLELIEFWGTQVSGGVTDGLPEGIFELRNALHDDLYDGHQNR
jgi:hypothetical protein